MPTLTFYATDEVAMQLDAIVRHETTAQDRKISRGDVLTPAIKKLYRQLIPPAHRTNKTTVKVTGDLTGMIKEK